MLLLLFLRFSAGKKIKQIQSNKLENLSNQIIFHMKKYRFDTDTTEQILDQLQYLVDTIPGILKNIPENEFSGKPAPDKWSKKEIIGHLIDSATNNHHRFVRAQFEEAPIILYDQDEWNNHGYYQKMDGHQLITFWEMYNRHIL